MPRKGSNFGKGTSGSRGTAKSGPGALAAPKRDDGDPPVARVLRVVADQRLAIGDAFDPAEAGFGHTVAQQRLACRFGPTGRERPVVDRSPRRQGSASVWPRIDKAPCSGATAAATACNNSAASGVRIVVPKRNMAKSESSTRSIFTPSGETVIRTCRARCCVSREAASLSRSRWLIRWARLAVPPPSFGPPVASRGIVIALVPV